MPKQIWKIDQFHGGLNENSDPRDIDDNEFAEIQDAAVDNIGKIVTIGGTASHASDTSSPSGEITAGYGLFMFSADRKGGHVFEDHLSGTHTSTDSSTVLTDSSSTWPVNGLVGATVYNITDKSSAVITSNDANTLTVSSLLSNVAEVVDVSGNTTDTSSKTFDDSDNDSYYIGNFPDTGDSYLCLGDSDTSATIDIYSNSNSAWGVDNMDLGTTGSVKPVFYYMDGALRVTDGNHGTTNSTKWLGYIKTEFFEGVPEHKLSIEYVGDGSGSATSDSNAAITGGTLDGVYNRGVTSGKVRNASVTYSGGGFTSTSSGSFAPSDNSVVVWAGEANNFLKFYDSWYTEDNDLASPSYFNNSTGDPGVDDIGFNLSVLSPGVTGSESSTWTGATYTCASTFIYDGHQESLLYNQGDVSGSQFTVTDGDKLTLQVYMQDPTTWTTSRKRVTGGRVYCRIEDTDDDWRLLADIDFNRGIRSKLNTDDYGEWQEYGNGDLKTAIISSFEMNPDTYQSINGFSPDESSLTNISYATACVSGRTVYVGGVRRKDEKGIIKLMGDAIFKSVPNKFDTFPTSNRLEVAVRDGENIVHLETYADRILQFKEKTMYIINISQNIEFLEDTYKFMGVKNPAAVAKTDFGVAWVNDVGCYLYDGQSVTNLLEKNGKKVISDTTWQSFANLTPMIGYIPKKRQLIVVEDCSNQGGTGSAYLYDMVTRSWVKAQDDTFIPDEKLTNFIVDWNNDLVFADNSNNILKWDSTPDASTTNFKIITKDIDFGQPAQRKKVYRVRISYKGDASALVLKYSINGDSNTYYNFLQTNADGTPSGSSDTSPLLNKTDLTVWHHAELKPTIMSEANNIYSFQLHLSSSAGSDFEINDISIIYRNKPVK